MTKLTHLDDKGEARMVDVTDKAVTEREASAEAWRDAFKSDIDTIKDVMETEVLCKDYKTSFNCLKATKTEPWDQWAMDIIAIK